jgi:putative Mg2+ transporter-C (MgtC) family protein
MTAAALHSMAPAFAFRLLLAGLLGFAIGLDREYRAKEAGVRTHFLVALGSALIMIVSQWGFSDTLGTDSFKPDPGRMAAQIISGIGFIGAGAIMVHKEFVRGLTTAAGLWVVAGIGTAVGGGLYILACAGTLLALFGMEVLPLFTRKLKTKCSTVIFVSDNRDDLRTVTKKMDECGYHILSYSVEPVVGPDGKTRVRLGVRAREYGDENKLMLFMQQFPGVTVEGIE